MSRFHVATRSRNPGLHLWREGTNTRLYLRPTPDADAPGWVHFEYELEPGVQHDVHCLLFEFDEQGNPANFENAVHQRKLPREVDGHCVPEVWLAHGTQRVLTRDPRLEGRTTTRINLISERRYRPSQLFLWDPLGGGQRRVDFARIGSLGPVFELALSTHEMSLFAFKFIRKGEGGDFDAFEPDVANRLWCAADGAELWTHSEAALIVPREPEKKRLTLYYRQEFPEPARLRLWQENSEVERDLDPLDSDGTWSRYETLVYSELRYGALFHNPDLPPVKRWEHEEAKRRLSVRADTTYWVLEGERTLFDTEPAPEQEVELEIAARSPLGLAGALHAHVWVNHARAPLHESVAEGANGRIRFRTFPELVTSLKFRDENGHWESLDRHWLRAPSAPGMTIKQYVVLDRPKLLDQPPPHDLFQDPPFEIRRPGAYAEHGYLHFVVHAPAAARLRLIGEWAEFQRNPIEMRLTRDGSYFWVRVPIEHVLAGLRRDTYHGAEYKFVLDDDEELQDPAASWVKSSWSRDASKLVQSDLFEWHDQNWQRPSWDYLTVYQLHAARFTRRHVEEPPLRRVAREIDGNAAYLRELGVTAILLLPVNEVGTENSWGYDPAYFYAIESSYGGPDALKELVDVCHGHGFAVLLDVVFNHAGTTDNVLWSIANQTFFDGDTAWGAMINFDHPQVRHFFAQNLVYLANEFHIDGFRLDHTATIVHSDMWDAWSGSVRVRGSGGGWEFLHALRAALHEQADTRCLLMAEHLPNEWSLTNPGGPMDTQWCDDFHDRLIDACRRELWVMPRLAEAYMLSQAASWNWYGATNYPESHDEVGNVRDRVAFVAGYGQGLRMSKVAAAATLFSRGIPLFFMGAESGEDQQFEFGSAATLDLELYQRDPDRSRIRAFFRVLAETRRNNSRIAGPACLRVTCASGQFFAFTRGDSDDYFVLLNFGGWSGRVALVDLGFPHGTYRELWNSTWPAFAIQSESEGEHTNGGRDARIERWQSLEVPDYGAVVLERV